MTGNNQSSFSHNKPLRLSTTQVAENIEAMFEYMPFKSRWTAVENFIQLGGVVKCFQVIAIAYDWTFPGRSEMVKSALDVLAICSISPRAQLQFCERIDLPDDTKSVAFTILLGAAEGEFVHVSIFVPFLIKKYRSRQYYESKVLHNIKVT